VFFLYRDQAQDVMRCPKNTRFLYLCPMYDIGGAFGGTSWRKDCLHAAESYSGQVVSKNKGKWDLVGVKHFVKLALLILSDTLRYFKPIQGDSTAKNYRFKYVFRPYRLLQVKFDTCRIPPIFMEALWNTTNVSQHVLLRAMTTISIFYWIDELI